MTYRLTALVAAALVFVAGPAVAGPTRSSPIQVGTDGTVFVVNPDSNTVSRLEFDVMHVGTLVAEATVGTYPRTIALDGTHVFSADQNSDTVSRLDQAGLTNLRQASLGFGCNPYGVAVTPSGSRVVVSCQGPSDAVILDADLNTVARVRLNWPQARAIAIASDGSRAFVTHFLTEEPGRDAHVSVVDLANNSIATELVVPADTTTCENQNAGQGAFNLVSAITIMPDGAPAEVAGQIWVGGTQQNNVSKGLFKRNPGFKSMPEAAMFPFTFAPFPDGGGSRNVYRPSFHDVTRFGIYKLDGATGKVVGKIDIDEADNGSDIAFSPDGVAAYVVDHQFNSYHIFNTVKGQRVEDVTTLFAGPSRYGPGGAEDDHPCVPEALAPVVSERPFRMQPQAQITTIDGYDPADVNGMPVLTGVDFDAVTYMASGVSQMRPVPDGIGTAPMGVALSPDGNAVYIANYLSRNVVVAAAATPLDGTGRPANFRCTNNIAQSCGTTNDCTSTGGSCNHPGGAPCTTDADCGPNGPCITNADCVPLLLGAPVRSILGGDLPAALLDGKILFNTAARDSSVPNGVGLGRPAPIFNDANSATLNKTPGAVTSTAHDASYVTCTSCHADFGGQDGRTWDFSQFGASLRNTMDLRGRPGFAPGKCKGNPGTQCFFDAACGDGDFCVACVGAECATSPNVPPNVQGADRERYFNPMLTVHWNGDRDEVEDFENTYRQLMGAGDCDTAEDLTGTCLGALIQRSPATSSDPADVSPHDLGSPNRNIRGPLTGKVVGIRLTHMADFVYSLTDFVKNPNAPTAASERGRKIFNDPSTKCADCHNGGPGAGKQFFTDKKPNAGFDPSQPGAADHNNPFVRHDVGTANVFDVQDPNAVALQNQTFQNPRVPIPGTRGTLGDYVTPVLNDLWNTAPYLHDGSAHTLLQVVRACNTALDGDACFQPNRGRNLNAQHGRTDQLTPQQLNDLAEFQKTLTLGTVVGTNERVLRFGALDLSRLQLKFGKKKGKDSFKVRGNLSDVPAGLDPAAGTTFVLAAPNGEAMQIVSRTLQMKGSAKKAKGRSTEAGLVNVTLRQAGTGKLKVVASGKKLDLSALNTGVADITVSLDIGGTTFTLNRNLTGKKRTLNLPKKKR